MLFPYTQNSSTGRTLIKMIATEKGKLITENDNLKYGILNADQPEISELQSAIGARIVTFGRKKNADVVVKSIVPSLNGTSISLFINHPPAIAFGDSRWRTVKSFLV